MFGDFLKSIEILEDMAICARHARDITFEEDRQLYWDTWLEAIEDAKRNLAQAWDVEAAKFEASHPEGEVVTLTLTKEPQEH